MDAKAELYRQLLQKYGVEAPEGIFDNSDLSAERGDIYSQQSEQMRRRSMGNKLMEAARGFGSIQGKMPERGDDVKYAPVGSSQLQDVDRKQKIRDYLMGKFFDIKKSADAAEAKKEIQAAKALKPAKEKDNFSKETTIRKEFSSSPEVKQFKTVQDSYNVIQNIEASPAGDMSLIFAYMKMLDPGSTVREGEFANAQNAANVPDRIRNVWNKLSTGERLNDQQREDFKAQANQLYQSRKKSYEDAANQYRGLGTQYGLDPNKIAPSPSPEQKKDYGDLTPEEIQEYERLRVKHGRQNRA